jgi:hypothetical protein
MTRPISTALLAELGSSNLKPFALIDMDIEGHNYRYTDCDVDIKYGGNIYASFPFQSGDIHYSVSDMIDSMTIAFDNVGLQLYSAFVAYEAQGSAFSVKIVLLDDSYDIIDEDNVYVLFDGFIDEWTLDELKIQVTAVNIFTTWKQKTLSRHPASCRWKEFKGKECKYGGDELWCDRSYKRCSALLNTDNFGGFRHLPELEDKELWWGRTPRSRT